MLQAIIFDMDGVLLDSGEIILKSFNAVLQKYGVEISKEEHAKSLGRSLRDQLSLWKTVYPKIPADLGFETLAHDSLEFQLDIIERELKSDSALLSLIAEAKALKLKIAVATSSTRPRAERILRLLGLIDKLDVLVTAEDIIKHKPDPEIFLKTANILGIASQNCVVIEDAENGISAASQANMKTIAKLTVHQTRENLALADLIFEDFAQLKLADIQKLFSVHH